uniref:Endonuclease/exonuclease/phosphatase domain-containing protein n=1 Tax=Leptobrachium leishanense TaxID=445787 RepID=A0A8C5PEU3_9ANUR
MGNLVICGDLNIVLDSSSSATNRQRAQLRARTKLLSEFGLYDVWRMFHPGETDYSFFSQAYKTYSRLDYFLTRGEGLRGIQDCIIGPISWSDHAPVTLQLADSYSTRGNSTWRLNDSLLSRPEVVEDVRHTLTHYFSENLTPEISPPILWQAHKTVVRGVLIKWGSHFKRLHHSHRLDLLQQIDQKTTEHKLQPTDQLLSELMDLRNQLLDLDKRDYVWAARRLRAKYYIYGNRPSKMLANRLRARATASRIGTMVDAAGGSRHQPQHIADCFAEYYLKLYNLKDDEHTHQPTVRDIVPFLQEIGLPSLTEDQQRSLSSPISPWR